MYARKNFGLLLNEVSLLQETFIIQRSNRSMAALVPIEQTTPVTVASPEIVEAYQTLVKRIKGPRSKKLEKAITDLGALLHCQDVEE
ncbi:MAG: hypothetical protein D6B25_01385 [Desulfobulbaceae bacterium]|nr:MAG: hypothetical protein D6B25_01385 [Desulfobulbaceae bacterium]